MRLADCSPYELGESNQEEAISYLVRFLEKGNDNEKRLAASAVAKLTAHFPEQCMQTFPYLIHNLDSERTQVRQYTLRALKSLSADLELVQNQDLLVLRKIMMDDPKDYNRVLAEELLAQWNLDTDEDQLTDGYRGHCFPEGASRKVIEKAEIASTLTSVELVKDEEQDAFYFRSLEKEGIHLNASQLKATRHFNGPALVLAGAGSGKTRVLSSRAGYLVSVQNINPKKILLLTFTRKAAEEMKDRIALLPGLAKSAVREMTSGTYHSVFLRILKSQGEKRGILSSDKRKHVFLKIIMKEMGLKDEYEPEFLLSLLSHYKNNMVLVDEMPARTSIEKEMKEILEKYETKKQENNLMDFDDILLDSYYLLKRNQSLLKMLQKRFAYIFCDEWQDTNPIQYELIKMLAKPENNLFVVGDDDQMIYEFTGADSSILLNFSNEFPDTQLYHLDINYRSTATIVGLANKVISYNERRYAKNLKASRESEVTPLFSRPRDTNEEAEMIVRNIIRDVEQGKRKYKDFAVLFRANSNSRAIFDELVLKNVPFVTYGDAATFYEQSIVKPVMDYLRLSLDGGNLEAAKGVLPSLYLNQEKAFDFLSSKELENPKKIVLAHLLDVPDMKEYQKKQIYERIQLIGKLNAMAPLDAVRDIRFFYDKYLEADERRNVTMHKDMIQDTLAEIESSARKFQSIQSFVAFVDEIIMKNKNMEDLRKDSDADVVKLMTIHKSKGLEFPVVYLICASEQVLPHKSALDVETRRDIIVKNKEKNFGIEGERRLAYVAITRAEEELYISSPRLYSDENTGVSRFIMDVFTAPKVASRAQKPEVRKTRQVKRKPERHSSTVVKQTTHNVKHTILVWECTRETCNAWKRIQSYEETIMETNTCHLCNGIMKQGAREM